MDTKKIGKIQVWIGCILLFATIVSSILIVKNIYIDTLVKGVATTAEEWGDSVKQINGTSIGASAHVVSFVVTEATIFKMTLSVFITCALIVAILSIILITQGLVNLNRK